MYARVVACFQGRNTFLKPLKWYKSLQMRKGRRQHGCFAIEGIRAVSKAIELAPQSVCEILVDQSCRVDIPPHTAAVRYLTDRQYSYISAHQTPQGIMAILRIPEAWEEAHLPAEVPGRILFLEDVQDPGNIGTLIRTAAAFAFEGIIMTGRCADPFGPKALQASAGSVCGVWIRRTDAWLSLLKTLKERAYILIAAHMGGESVWRFSHEDKIILALGNEGGGLSSEVLDHSDSIYTIPINREKAESLNVAVAGGICMGKAIGM